MSTPRLLPGPSPQLSSTAEDIFNDSAASLFGREAEPTSHGNPGSTLVYQPSNTPNTPPPPPPLTLTLSDPRTEPHRRLFAHYIWNAALVLCSLIESNHVLPQPQPQNNDNNPAAVLHPTAVLDPVAALRPVAVLELGAGSGLCGLVAASSASGRGVKTEVLLTDYPAAEVLGALEGNVARNAGANGWKNEARGGLVSVGVRGHRWGDVDGQEEEGWMRGRVDVVLCADCLWVEAEHGPLLSSMKWFLRWPEGRVWVVAGFHTGGRERVGRFFDLVKDDEEDGGLLVERIWERDCNEGVERGWERVRRDEDLGERKRWVVCAVLKWRDGDWGGDERRKHRSVNE